MESGRDFVMRLSIRNLILQFNGVIYLYYLVVRYEAITLSKGSKLLCITFKFQQLYVIFYEKMIQLMSFSSIEIFHTSSIAMSY